MKLLPHTQVTLIFPLSNGKRSFLPHAGQFLIRNIAGSFYRISFA